ncbi:BRCT domain-containing protein [Clostridium sp.]|uniref:BRCT domain-containing protein n=1 Tax=Clostridium sp. TaxID=1506 RepID=UPI002616154C|nr:BRCT domain-containing protein [Clostridium sp.]
MITPTREWKEFSSIEEKLLKLKEYKIISSGAKEVKDLYYKGAYTKNVDLCDVVGFVDENEIVLNIKDNLHSIHPDYFIDMQKSEKFIIVDIETPMSLYPKDGIREVALLVVEDFRVIDKLHLGIVNNEEEYKKGYGYGLDPIETNEEMKDKFNKFITKYKYPLVAHNASFDRSFLLHWNWIDENREFNCSLKSIRQKEKLKSYKLVELLKYYNIKNSQDHNAIQDVLDLLEVLKKVKVDRWVSVNKEGKVNKDYSEEKKSINRNNLEEDSKPKTFFKYNKTNKEEEKRKLEEAAENIMSEKLKDKVIVFTGESKTDRVELKIMAIKNGGVTKDGITKKTNLLVLGENPGKSKITKGKEYGIEIINEDEFLSILNND